MASSAFKLVAGATSPVLSGVINNIAAPTQEAFPAGSTVTLEWTKRGGTAFVIPGVILDLAARTVSIGSWPAGATEAGRYKVLWVVTRGDNALIEKYPGADVTIKPA